MTNDLLKIEINLFIYKFIIHNINHHMQTDVRSVAETIFKRNKFLEFQKVLGIKDGFKYLIIEDENDIRDPADTQFKFANDLEDLFRIIKSYIEYNPNFHVQYYFHKNYVSITLREDEFGTKMPCLDIYGVDAKDKLLIKKFIKKNLKIHPDN